MQEQGPVGASSLGQQHTPGGSHRPLVAFMRTTGAEAEGVGFLVSGEGEKERRGEGGGMEELNRHILRVGGEGADGADMRSAAAVAEQGADGGSKVRDDERDAEEELGETGRKKRSRDVECTVTVTSGVKVPKGGHVDSRVSEGWVSRQQHVQDTAHVLMGRVPQTRVIQQQQIGRDPDDDGGDGRERNASGGDPSVVFTPATVVATPEHGHDSVALPGAAAAPPPQHAPAGGGPSAFPATMSRTRRREEEAVIAALQGVVVESLLQTAPDKLTAGQLMLEAGITRSHAYDPTFVRIWSRNLAETNALLTINVHSPR